MTDDLEQGGIDSVPRRAAEAAAALDALKEPAERAARSIEDAFGRAGAGLTQSLARAAADGEISLAELARAVLAAINAAAGGTAGACPPRSRRRRARCSPAPAPTADLWSAAEPIWSANGAPRSFGRLAPVRSNRSPRRA